jgi:UDP-glucose 4-epimerase
MDGRTTLQYAPVIGLFKRQFQNNQPVTIVGDGEQRRDFTFISDIVEANISAMNASAKAFPFKIYNVGTGKNYSINEIADLIGAEKVYINERPAEVRETLADIQDTIKDLNWNPKVKIEDVINDY